ncbi:hypothetical protein NQ318_013085 [Aromia moschata]|uniref:Coactosin-like protein n=1 Tax=Aromia moschata TaxID=1265417 RepID=A0AAV8Y161_9CUCU|nr:hypothetical protein NQ318_013085 [Aromia moschata]
MTDGVILPRKQKDRAVFKFEGPRVVCSATGAEFGKFKEQFTEDERAFGYIRIQTGDEMSKRQKFVFITWVGSSVSVLKRAKMSTDKAVVKNLISNFAVELQIENPSEIDVGTLRGGTEQGGRRKLRNRRPRHLNFQRGYCI